MNQMIDKVETVPHVSNFTPATVAHAGASTQISPDGTIGFATVTFDQENLGVHHHAGQAVRGHRPDGQRAGPAGGGGRPGGRGGEPGVLRRDRPLLGVLLAGIVLALVFGSVFAMAAPADLGPGLAGHRHRRHRAARATCSRCPSSRPSWSLLIGLGVGVDYALFIVTRHRQGLIAGNDAETSIVNAVNTSGRAVLFAGIIVCIALLGMFALGVSFLYGLAVAAAIGVAFTMIAALTLLPPSSASSGPRC